MERDGAYHQGTVWPWLMGPFVEAWLRVHGAAGVRERFLAPLYAHLDHFGIGHISPYYAQPRPRSDCIRPPDRGDDFMSGAECLLDQDPAGRPGCPENHDAHAAPSLPPDDPVTCLTVRLGDMDIQR